MPNRDRDIAAEVTDQGFALVPAAVEGGTLARLAEVFETALAGAQAHRSKGRPFALRNVLQTVPMAAEFALSEAIHGLAATVLGPDARPVKGILFDKSAAANWKVSWHQDVTVAVAVRRDVPGFAQWTEKDGIVHAQAPNAVLEGMVALRIHLDDCDAANGGLVVLPGSHRRGKLSPAERAQAIAAGQEHLCAARAGEALLMRPLLLHRSGSARADRRRRVLHLEFSARDLPGGLEWAA